MNTVHFLGERGNGQGYQLLRSNVRLRETVPACTPGRCSMLGGSIRLDDITTSNLDHYFRLCDFRMRTHQPFSFPLFPLFLSPPLSLRPSVRPSLHLYPAPSSY